MPNMSYCRFQNTLLDLRDCYHHLDDPLNDIECDDIGDLETVSQEEHDARKELIALCQKISDNYGEDDDDF